MLALSFAVAVVLMCKGHLEDKYRGMYDIINCQPLHFTVGIVV